MSSHYALNDTHAIMIKTKNYDPNQNFELKKKGNSIHLPLSLDGVKSYN